MKKSFLSIFGCLILFMLPGTLLAQYYSSPAERVILPEAIWALASGGGTWYTEVQIIDQTGGGTEVDVYFNYGGGNYTGPISIWNSPGQYRLFKSSNILMSIDLADPGPFSYYGTVGSIEFVCNLGHEIHVTARTYNGNYSKSMNGLSRFEDANSSAVGRYMMLLNLVQNSTYRSAVGIYNHTSDDLTVLFALFDGNNNLIGMFIKTFVGYDFQSFNPFVEAGHPTGTYGNCVMHINATGGLGEIMCFGATSNNTTNDPAAHVAVQY
jgi:hypothetical protein